MTSNVVLASAARYRRLPPPPAAATATGAAAETPHLVSRSFTRSAISITVALLSSSTIFALSRAILIYLSFRLVAAHGHEWFKSAASKPTIYVVVCLFPTPPAKAGMKLFIMPLPCRVCRPAPAIRGRAGPKASLPRWGRSPERRALPANWPATLQLRANPPV